MTLERCMAVLNHNKDHNHQLPLSRSPVDELKRAHLHRMNGDQQLTIGATLPAVHGSPLTPRGASRDLEVSLKARYKAIQQPTVLCHYLRSCRHVSHCGTILPLPLQLRQLPTVPRMLRQQLVSCLEPQPL